MKICIICGKEFKSKPGNYKTCSKECSNVSRKIVNRKMWKNWYKNNYVYKGNYHEKCVICGKEIDKKRSIGHGAKTCSEKCSKLLYRKEWKDWYYTNWEDHKKENREKGKKYRDNQRNLILEHYGGIPPRCACCDESHIEFLTVDHIHGNGGKQGINSATLYNWLIQNNYPEGYQILCMNCNFVKGNMDIKFCRVHHPELYINQKV